MSSYDIVSLSNKERETKKATQMRTMPMTWSDKSGQGHCPCAACGREIKGRRWAVHVIGGGARVLHPHDEFEYQPDGGEMGLHFVGPECRKKFGEFAVYKDRTE